MLDSRLLSAIRRFWSRPEVESAYQAIFTAYHDRITRKVVITSKSNDSESASSQIVVERDDYLAWMDALENRLAEMDAAAAGELLPGETEHVDFSQRYIRT